MKRSFCNRDIFLLRDEDIFHSGSILLIFFYIDISFKSLLRKTNVCLSGLNASCAAIFFMFILHICPCVAEISASC